MIHYIADRHTVEDTIYSVECFNTLMMIVQDTFPFLMWEISRYLLCRNLSVLIVLCNSIECDGQHANVLVVHIAVDDMLLCGRKNKCMSLVSLSFYRNGDFPVCHIHYPHLDPASGRYCEQL